MRRIVIDTREQRPWVFPEWVSVKVGTVPTGDYALEGDNGFAVERKSLDDFLGTVFSDWHRFLREIGRMEGAGFTAKVIVVESDFHSFCFTQYKEEKIRQPQHNHPLITPQAVMAKIAELAFMNVQVLFCGNAQLAAAMAYALLANRDKQLTEAEDLKCLMSNNSKLPSNG